MAEFMYCIGILSKQASTELFMRNDCSRARFSVSSSRRLVLRDVPLDAALFVPALSADRHRSSRIREGYSKEKNIAAKKSIRRHKNKRSTLPQTLAGKSKKNPQSEQKKNHNQRIKKRTKPYSSNPINQTAHTAGLQNRLNRNPKEKRPQKSS